MSFRMKEGRLFVENGQQVKFDFLPALSSIILNSKEEYDLTVIDETDLLNSQTKIIDIGLKG
jgi:hypothetical protein